MRRIFTTALLIACLPLAACGKKDEGTTKVQMKDMEVVDGTATDAMTDLDGVQSEGTAVALSTGNATAASNSSTPARPAADKPAGDKPAGDDAEVVADQ
ncbi:hypothetical protein [Sphingobium sp. CAP-1]|uniref:hypothetical protein n=1 Tax=Sphingobium sp. CAP-1 TaxID=2676077 RepID=UPI0012BB2DBE|nr:hypothetical protein [Sphingobium sp. CAP-1]QGP79971.1 hypothetical protein GL174_14010 [Sphingobium sp. CAP-1]